MPISLFKLHPTEEFEILHPSLELLTKWSLTSFIVKFWNLIAIQKSAICFILSCISLQFLPRSRLLSLLIALIFFRYNDQRFWITSWCIRYFLEMYWTDRCLKNISNSILHISSSSFKNNLQFLCWFAAQILLDHYFY